MATLKPGAVDLERYLKILKGKPLEAAIDSLISLLKRRQIQGSELCAIATAHILLQVVAKAQWIDVDSLLETVQKVGLRLVAAQPKELVVGNIVRRVLSLIRDEAVEDRNEDVSETATEAGATPITAALDPSKIDQWPPSTSVKQDAGADFTSAGSRPTRAGVLTSMSSFHISKSLFSLLEVSPPTDASGIMVGSPFGKDSGASTPLRGQSTRIHALRSEVIEGIEELKDEIGQVDDQIAVAADVQIHPGDYVLVHQPSATVQKFILRAATKRKFTVFIASGTGTSSSSAHEAAPYASFRKKLAAAGIAAICILNGGIMAYMPRISKVILSARAVLANGGVLTDAGVGVIARAAKEQGNPVIILSGVYKLCPESYFDEKNLVEWGGSMGPVDFSDGGMVNGVEVRGAVREFVPPELIDTYITNLGAHSRNHLSTIIADHYKPEDIDFHLWSTEADL